MSLAVLLDSPAWAERRTTSDRDAANRRPRTDHGLAKVVRVWLPDWLEDREGVVARLVVAAHEGGVGTASGRERVVTTSFGTHVVASPQDSVTPQDAPPTLFDPGAGA